MNTIWPYVGMVSSLAAVGGIAAIPGLNRFALGSVKEDWLGSELELDCIQSDGQTVQMKNGTLFRVIALFGESYDTKPEEEQINLHAGRQQFLNQVGALGVRVRFFGQKRLRPLRHDAVWPNEILKEIGDAEAALFEKAFSIHWYIVLSSKDARALETAMGRGLPMLARYRASVLTAADKEAGADQPCPLTNFLNALVCGENPHSLPRLSQNISYALPATDLHFEKASGLLTISAPTPVHHRLVVIRRWPESVDGQLSRKIMALPCEVDVCQVAVPESREMATTLLTRKIKETSTNPLSAVSTAADFAAALELVAEGEVWWKTQYHITLRSSDLEHLDEQSRALSEWLAEKRILFSVETKGVPVVWLNRLPHRNQLLRPLRVFSDALAALWPMQFSPAGRGANPWGKGPVRLFSTETGQPYSFQFHVSDHTEALGNFVVFAPSGSGKSTFITHLLTGFARHAGVRSYILDSKEGTRFMVEAFGGAYQNYDSLALNPLAVAKDTAQGRQRLMQLLEAILGESAQTPESSEIIDHMASLAMKLPPEKRSLNAIFGTTVPNNTEQRKIFGNWVIDDEGKVGRYAHIFNAPQDGLAALLSSAPVVGINMNEALKDPRLAPPIVSHIIDTIVENIAVGSAIFVDEAANLLGNPVFAAYVKELYREVRKQRGIVGLAFQDPKALMDSGITSTVLDNTPTLIFFPNPAGKAVQYEEFNLNDEQKKFIFNSPPDNKRRVLVIRRDPITSHEESVILNIDLGLLNKGGCLKYFRSGPGAVDIMNGLRAQWGDQWVKHL
jgi:type IV secretion system protein VirB4